MNLLIPKYIKKIFILSQSADPAPPLGTVLGNLGCNSSQFCTAFNQYTKNLPNYLKLCVSISIFENRTTSFKCGLPTTSYILSLLKYDFVVKNIISDRIHEKLISCIDLNELVKLSKFKMPHLSLKESVSILLGTVKAHGFKVKKKNT